MDEEQKQEIEDKMNMLINQLRDVVIDESIDAKEYKIVDLANKKAINILEEAKNTLLSGGIIKLKPTNFK